MSCILQSGPSGCLFYVGGRKLLRSCSYCSNYHKTTEKCAKKPTRPPKETTAITKFRGSSNWKKKSLEIRQLDLFLCLHCKSQGKYIFNNLEVHHITPIAKNWHLRLDNNNLITLCHDCHTLAEMKEIPKYKLEELISFRKE